MNACGQHNMADIGFQGMSIRTPDKTVIPALQVLLGGRTLGNGDGIFADKVIKLPSKRAPEALRRILDDFENNSNSPRFLDYYLEKGGKYFYNLLKSLADISILTPEDFIDWGTDKRYVKAIGVGECAGVMIDLVSTLFLESQEKIDAAKSSIREKSYSNAIYLSYGSIINAAKAMLLAENQKTNSHASIVSQFDEFYIESGKIDLGVSFSSFVYQINEFKPSENFAISFNNNAAVFLEKLRKFREQQLNRI